MVVKEGFFPAYLLPPVCFLYFLSHLLLISNIRIILGLHHSWALRLGCVGSPFLILSSKRNSSGWWTCLFGGCSKASVFPFSLHVLNLHCPALATVPGPIHVSHVGQCRHVTFRCRTLNPEGQHESYPCFRVTVMSLLSDRPFVSSGSILYASVNLYLLTQLLQIITTLLNLYSTSKWPFSCCTEEIEVTSRNPVTSCS